MTPSVEVPAQTAPWDIETVQHRLVELGYDVGDVDGLLGPKTGAALRTFQADRGLPVTGLPDGDSQRALFAAEPRRSEFAAPPPDDPPSLDAVPLGPVQVAPLAPMVTATPHEGLTVEPIAGQQAGETAPSAGLDHGAAALRGQRFSDLGAWERWLRWAAVGLGVLGAVLLIAAVVLRLAKRKTVGAERPRPKPAARSPAARTRATAAATTTARGAHVFGVNVPPSKGSGSG